MRLEEYKIQVAAAAATENKLLPFFLTQSRTITHTRVYNMQTDNKDSRNQIDPGQNNINGKMTAGIEKVKSASNIKLTY